MPLLFWPAYSCLDVGVAVVGFEGLEEHFPSSALPGREAAHTKDCKRGRPARGAGFLHEAQAGAREDESLGPAHAGSQQQAGGSSHSYLAVFNFIWLKWVFGKSDG